MYICLFIYLFIHLNLVLEHLPNILSFLFTCKAIIFAYSPEDRSKIAFLFLFLGEVRRCGYGPTH